MGVLTSRSIPWTGPVPRGGRRSGAPGKAYPNRSDMTQAPRAASGQEYGKAKAQLDAQRAMPLSATPPPPTVDVTPISAESQRSGEPITAGLPVGAGPGPQAGGPYALSPVDELRAIFQAYPNDDLAELLSNLRAG